MESKMTVVKKGDNFPLRAMPEETLNNKILELSEWLTRLLSIKPDDSNVDKLEVLLPMIKYSCWSMTISEIQKAFTMYVQNKLPIKPRSNYLDVILFSQVIDAYKSIRPIEKKEHKLNLSDVEKENNAYLNCIYAFDDFKQDSKVHYHYHTVYDTLKSKGLLKALAKAESVKLMEVAKSRLINESITNKDMKDDLRKIRNTENERQCQIDYGKCILVERFFENLVEKKVHIKSMLK